MKATHKIVDISPSDAFYEDREKLIGKEGIATDIYTRLSGYVGCAFDFLEAPDVEGAENGAGFYMVKLEEL